MEQIGNSNLRCIKAKEGDRVEIFMKHVIMIEEIISIGTDQSRGRPRYAQNYRNDYRRGNFRGNVRTYQNFERQNRGGYRGNFRNENYNRERGRSRSRERSFYGILIIGEMTEAKAIVDQGQDQE